MKLINVIKKSTAAIYLLIVFLLFVDLLICQNFIDQMCKKNFALPNVVLLLIGLLIVATISLAIIKLYERIKLSLDRILNKRFIVLLSILLFFVQLYIVKNVYFWTGWDAEVILASAQSIANGEQLVSPYYNSYPNNIFITLLYALIIRINASVGIFSTYGFEIVALQCLFSAITAYLVYSVTLEITKNKFISLFSFFVYAIWIGFSPWFVIPYSDASGILFPILSFRLYQIAKNTNKNIFKFVLWGILGFVAFIGFKIKPQIVIVFIAILIMEGVSLVAHIKDKENFFKRILALLICLTVFATSLISFGIYQNKQSVIPVDSEKAIGMTHFLMMGLCQEKDGVYSGDDVAFSEGIEDASERSAENLRVAKERISEMGVAGLVRHLTRKTLVTFGDGTFAFGNEGRFFNVIPDAPNTISSPFLRSFYYPDGENNGLFNSVMQCIWLTVLLLSAFAALYLFKRSNQRNSGLSVMILALIGLTAFETLFEARARYLFTYAPMFIICASVGLFAILNNLKERRKIK